MCLLCISVRRHAGDTDYLPYRDLVGTTLHELTHMVCSCVLLCLYVLDGVFAVAHVRACQALFAFGDHLTTPWRLRIVIVRTYREPNVNSVCSA